MQPPPGSTVELEEAPRYRKPLRWEEVPLPPGYSSAILEPGYKAAQREEYARARAENLATRAALWRRCTESKEEQRKVLALCAVDRQFWIDHFVSTYDDRVGEDEPLFLYPFQVSKIVEPYGRMLETKGRTRYTQCVVKSRGVGYTWVELALRVHSWLFRLNHSILIGSVSRKEVDDGGQEATHESLFGKIRYIVKMLPRWMRDALLGPLWEKDEFNSREKLKNPYKPRNLIVGKHFSGMFSRSGRFSEIWGDEIAHAEAMKDADKALKQATNRFSGGSTPLGKATFHYQLMSNEMRVVRITIHWAEHPELDVDWYNEQREHMTDEDIASELDCSFEGSAGGRVLPDVHVSTHFNAVGPDGSDLAEYQPGLPLQVILDPGIMDDMALVWGQWDERATHELLRGRCVDFVQTKGRPIDWCVPFILGEIPSVTHRREPWPYDYSSVERQIIARHKLWRPPSEVFGDAYGTTRNQQTGMSAYDELAFYGIDVCDIRIDDNVEAIAHLRLVLRHVRFARRLVEQRNGPAELVPTMADVVTQWRFPKRKEGDFREVKEPVKDMHDHGGDCLKIWASTITLPDPTVLPVGSARAYQEKQSDAVGGRGRWRLRR